jgi:hypothetical protein
MKSDTDEIRPYPLRLGARRISWALIYNAILTYLPAIPAMRRNICLHTLDICYAAGVVNHHAAPLLDAWVSTFNLEGTP